MVVLGLIWLLATGTLTYAAGRQLAATNAPKAQTPAVTPRPTLVVPDVRGQAFVFAKGILEDSGFGWRVTGGVQGYATNVVATQQPAAGSRVQERSGGCKEAGLGGEEDHRPEGGREAHGQACAPHRREAQAQAHGPKAGRGPRPRVHSCRCTEGAPR
jgi:hypothetical protein